MKKITLITGASSGLGKELARLYALDGNNLLLIGTNKERLNQVKEDLRLISNYIQLIYQILITVKKYSNIQKKWIISSIT